MTEKGERQRSDHISGRRPVGHGLPVDTLLQDIRYAIRTAWRGSGRRRRTSVTGLVLRKGMLFALMGIGVGLAGGLGFTALLESMLYGTAAIDPLTYGLASAALIAVSLGACLIPAHRAIRVDPLITMRSE